MRRSRVQPTSGYYNSVYSYLSSGHSTVVSAPSASFSCSRCRSSSSFLSFLSSLFGKRSWNVLACILVHMCSGIRGARAKGYPLGCLRKLQVSAFREVLQIIMFASFTTLIRCCCAHPGARRRRSCCYCCWPKGSTLKFDGM